jgi:hypothetical protein
LLTQVDVRAPQMVFEAKVMDVKQRRPSGSV